MEHFIIDDVRYKNEVIKLKENGWLVIKIDIDDDLQIERLKNAYPENWQNPCGCSKSCKMRLKWMIYLISYLI